MSVSSASNLNLNLNLNLASPDSLRAAGATGQPRFNTQEFRKLIDPLLDIVPANFAQKFPSAGMPISAPTSIWPSFWPAGEPGSRTPRPRRPIAAASRRTR